MKYLISFLLYLVCYNIYSQTPVRTQLNTVFANIDKSQVPTGFLQEYGEPLVPIDVFNGALTDSNKVDISAWYVTYATLSSSRIYGTNPLADLSTVSTAIANDANANAGSFVVPMLFADYNYLRPDAITANLLSASNNQLYDVAGRAQSPYYAQKLFAATPSIGYAATGTPSFIFKQDIFYNASSRSLSNIYIDFGDGRGYLGASWNTPIAAAYANTGTYQLKIKIIFTDNTVMECYSPFQVTQVQQQYYAARYYAGGAQTLPIGPTAAHSGGTVYYQLSTTNSSGKIKKPLIVAEGYDVYSIAPLLQNSNYSFNNFIADINATYPSFDFNGQLSDVAGYDLVFLDYNNGTDDIVRNAALLQDVITWVNTQKAQAGSSEQNVVLGISMGGLVARYCLANMTKQGLSHQTRLLITHDSPHQGANTPLGIQALVRAFSEVGIVQIATHLYGLMDLIPQLSQSVAVLNAPATQQMLLLSAINGTGGYSTNTFLSSTYRSMITFAPGGPQPTYQTLATSLGSECGTGSLTPGTNLFNAGGRFHVSPLPWIVRTSYNANVNVNALPNYGPSQSIMSLHIWTTIRILLVVNINVDLTNKSASSPANTLPWDGAPGGTQNIKDKIGGSIPAGTNSYTLGPFIQMFSTVSYAGDFCFVPAVSALDITTLDQPSLTKAYVGGISPTDPARVGNFIAQKYSDGSINSYNRSHPSFTPRNAQWIYDQMQGITNTLNCSSDCSTSWSGLLAGSTIVCPAASYSITNLPQGTTVTWSSSNPSGISIGATSGVASIVGSFQGSVTISAAINSSCNTVILTEPVSAGSLPYFTSSTPIVGPSQITVGSSANYHIDAVSGQTSYSWSVTSNWQIFGTPTLQVCEVIANAPAATKTLTFTARNTCGTVSASKSIQSVTTGGGGGGGGGCDAVAIATYPNPSKAGDITIDILPPGGGCNPNPQVVSAVTTGAESTTSTERVAATPAPTEGAVVTLAPTTTADEGAVVFYNSMGQEVFRSSYTGEAMKLSGLNLKPGIYYIHVMYKDKEYQKRLVVE